MARVHIHPLCIGLASLVVTIGSLGDASIALAQSTRLPADAFDVDLSELTDTGKKEIKRFVTTVRPGNCSDKIKVKVAIRRGGDPAFLQVLGRARHDAIQDYLRELGLKPDQFSLKKDVDNDANADDVQLSYAIEEDPPKLQVNWSRDGKPVTGKKAKPGDKIQIEIAARDDADARQTGIRRIQVFANDKGSERLFDHQLYDHEAYGGPQSRCEPQRQSRSWWTTYEVPRRPPPIVRLEVRTEDFAGNKPPAEVGEFSISDWHGRVDWSAVIQTAIGRKYEYAGHMDLALDYDGQGNLTGRVSGTQTQKRTGGPTCPHNTVTPGILDGKLVGSYNRGAPRSRLGSPMRISRSLSLPAAWIIPLKSLPVSSSSRASRKSSAI